MPEDERGKGVPGGHERAKPTLVEREGLPSELALEKELARRRAEGREGDTQERIAEIREQLAPEAAVEKPQTTPERVASYVEKNLPSYLKTTATLSRVYGSVVRGAFSILERVGKYRFEGRERIPKSGAVLAIANHTRFFDEAKMASLFERPSHIVSADMHFNMTPLNRWFLKKLGIIEVHATLRGQTDEEKEALLDRVKKTDKGAVGYYEKVIARDREPAELSKHREFIRTTVATLAKGEPVILFPEGLWLYEGNVMRKAYPGVELIAHEFKRLTGEDLPILPVGISDRDIKIGETTALERGQDVHDLMRQVAALLPEEARGYYKG